MRIAVVGPLHPWRGGIAQYLGLLGEALGARAEVRGVTFTRQYPGFLFPGESQIDETAPRPSFPVVHLLDSIGPWSWRRAGAHLGVAGEVAVFFGYVRRYKGLDVLLRAWPRVRERRPATLVVGGEFYEDAAPYRALATVAGNSVRLLDHYLPDDEVEALLKAA